MSNPNLVRKVSNSPAGSSGEVSFSDIVAQNEKTKNFVMNGNFDTWQRGTSQTWTTNGYYYERWFSGHTGANTIARQPATGLTGSTYCLRITYAGGTSNINDFYYMEDRDVDALKGKTVTWSMYVRRSGSLNNSWTLRVGKNATANTRTGGAWNEILSTTYSDTEIGTGNWTLLSVTFDVPNDGTANGLRLNMVNLAANVTTPGAYVEVTQMMLNIGDERAPFVPYGGTLPNDQLACQRYYETGHMSGMSDGSNAAVWASVFKFAVPKRAIPTVTFGTQSHFNGGYSIAGNLVSQGTTTLYGGIATRNPSGAPQAADQSHGVWFADAEFS